MNSKYLIATLIFGLLSIGACKTKKNINTAPKVANKPGSSITFSKGVCLGLCSQYNIAIEDMTLRYEGIVNVDRYGIFERKLTKSEKETVDLAFINSTFFEMDDQYPVDISDFPMLTMTYMDASHNKKVEGRTEFPLEFRDLRNKLESLTNVGEWTTIKEYPVNQTNDVTNRMHTNENVIENQIIVEMNEFASIGVWIRSYQKYSANLMRPLDKDRKIWLISYNTEKINPKDMLETIKKDSSIKSAEFNKVLMPRDH
jgi:Domain of unknown function (DUF6438)